MGRVDSGYAVRSVLRDAHDGGAGTAWGPGRPTAWRTTFRRSSGILLGTASSMGPLPMPSFRRSSSSAISGRPIWSGGKAWPNGPRPKPCSTFRRHRWRRQRHNTRNRSPRRSNPRKSGPSPPHHPRIAGREWQVETNGRHTRDWSQSRPRRGKPKDTSAGWTRGNRLIARRRSIGLVQPLRHRKATPPKLTRRSNSPARRQHLAHTRPTAVDTSIRPTAYRA